MVYMHADLTCLFKDATTLCRHGQLVLSGSGGAPGTNWRLGRGGPLVADPGSAGGKLEVVLAKPERLPVLFWGVALAGAPQAPASRGQFQGWLMPLLPPPMHVDLVKLI